MRYCKNPTTAGTHDHGMRALHNDLKVETVRRNCVTIPHLPRTSLRTIQSKIINKPLGAGISLPLEIQRAVVNVNGAGT